MNLRRPSINRGLAVHSDLTKRSVGSGDNELVSRFQREASSNCGSLLLLTLILSARCVVSAQVLGDSPANRERGVVGCMQTGSGITCPNRGANSTAADRERQAQRAQEEQRQRQTELERQADARRAQEAEAERQAETRRAQEAEAERQRQFNRERDTASRELKGVGGGDLQLKGIGGSTAFFDIKGSASPGQAVGLIKTDAPQGAVRDVDTAWKQIHCAAEIAGKALQKAKRLAAEVDLGTASAAELDEIRYLASESANALQGERLGVTCSPAPPAPSLRSTGSQTLAARFNVVLDKTVRAADRLYALQPKLMNANQKMPAARSQSVESLGDKVSGGAPISASDAATRERAEREKNSLREAQAALNAANDNAIGPLRRAQAESNAEKSNALSLLREAQAELNAVNSDATK